jgi:hypothetical protein
MKVKTLALHNACGKDRDVGEVYDHPNPQAEIVLGYVETVDEKPAPRGK